MVNESSSPENTADPFLNDPWTQPARASCQLLKWIGGYLCFTFLSGVILNGIIICILLQKQRRRSPIDIYIIALCVADLAAALLGIPLPLTSNLACRWLYGKYLCYYEGFVAYFVGMIGLYLLTALSLNRYWMIVTPRKEHYVTFSTAYLSVLLSILGGLFWALPPVLGWNEYRTEGVGTSCSISWQDRTVNVISYNTMMFIFAYTIPLFVMVYCNVCIYQKVRQSSKYKATWSKTRNASRSRHRKQNMERRMAKTIFLIIVTFVTAWTPYAIVAFISSFISPTIISPLGGTLPAIFAKSSIYFNPLVYMMSNSHVRSRLFHWRTMKKPTSETDSMQEPADVPTAVKLSRFTLILR